MFLLKSGGKWDNWENIPSGQTFFQCWSLFHLGPFSATPQSPFALPLSVDPQASLKTHSPLTLSTSPPPATLQPLHPPPRSPPSTSPSLSLSLPLSLSLSSCVGPCQQLGVSYSFTIPALTAVTYLLSCNPPLHTQTHTHTKPHNHTADAAFHLLLPSPPSALIIVFLCFFVHLLSSATF